MKNKSSLILLSLFAQFLTACGGGGSGSDSTQTNNQTTTPPPVVNSQPRELNTENWQSARLIETNNSLESNVEVIGSELVISITSQDINQGAHLQVYLNTDNKPQTGFQFDGEAWAESGVDYIIEDGDLFKSTANNTGWNWNTNIGAIDYSIGIDSVVAKIDLSLLGEICNNLKVGVMTRDEFWDISTFSPASSKMKNFAVTHCNTKTLDTVKPELTLLGANPLNVNINEAFKDPRATAQDDIDGDISNRITSSSTVDIAQAGNYAITYFVSDIAGNSTSLSRTVIVNEIAPPEGIVIDGNTNDWISIPALSSSADAIMKVSDDEEKLYILVTSNNLGDNIQVLMDIDNNATTGLKLSTQIGNWLAGADYMVENNSLDKSKSNTGWSWDYGIAPIEYIKTANTLEIAIKKSNFNLLANNIPMGYVSRTSDWNTNYILPTQSLPVYRLQFPNEINPVSANNDSVTTSNDTATLIDVRANDSSSTNSALKINRLLTQPSSGSARITQNKVLYTPDSTYTGTVTFSYEISDSFDNRDTANINVIVTEPVDVNTAPIANNDSATTIGINTANISVLSNDTDANNDTLQVIEFTQPANGLVTLTNATSVLNYTPTATFSGTDTFTYTVSDGYGGTDSANVSVTVPVNNFPDAIEDSVNVNFNETITVNVLSNDLDPDGDTLSVASIVQPTIGTAVLNTNGTIFFDPQNNIGSFSVGYIVSDGRGGTNFAVLTISSTDPNDGNDAYPTILNEAVSTPKNIPIFIDVLANDYDADGDVLILDQVDYGQNGITTKVDGGVLYTPNPGFTGTDLFYYGVHDGFGHNGSGFVEVTVTP